MNFRRAIKRLGRALVSILITGAATVVTGEPKLMILAPIIQAVGKYLRDKFGLKYVPF